MILIMPAYKIRKLMLVHNIILMFIKDIGDINCYGKGTRATVG